MTYEASWTIVIVGIMALAITGVYDYYKWAAFFSGVIVMGLLQIVVRYEREES